MHRKRFLQLSASMCFLIGWLVANAPGATTPPTITPPELEIEAKQATLSSILRSIDQVEHDLAATQAELRSPRAEGRQEELTQRIQSLSDKLKQLHENFNEIATGTPLTSALAKKQAEELNWQQRVVELLSPVINELRRLTARPREISQLRMEIDQFREQRDRADNALQNLDQLMGQISDPALTPALRQLQKEWQARRQDISTQLSIATQQLGQKLNEQQPLSTTIKDVLQIFFRSRGRNFLLACLAFAAFWLIFQWLQGGLQRFTTRRRRHQSFSTRLFNVLVIFAKAFGATFSALLVLYFFGDWVLLTLAIVFLIGLIWTSKSAVPRLWKEAMLLLNLGQVREGERIVYNGLPWLVQALNFRALLVNPELLGGRLHLPLHDLFELRSRPFDTAEPWFPTRLDDWVLLGDQTLGKVIVQTPEVVRLILLGGSRRTFSTTDFLAQSPTVLSTGFRLSIPFGIDYQHQALITQEIPTILAQRMREDLGREGYEKDLVSLKVEFAEAAASSLNLQVLADFHGAAAPHYLVLSRALQRICVAACNDYGWVIPFTQLTLHMASPADAAVVSNGEGTSHDGPSPRNEPSAQPDGEDHSHDR